MSFRQSRWVVLSVMVSLVWLSQARGHGIVVPGAGPVNRSMAGAGVAAPLDAAGSLMWNPASITGMKQSEFVMGLELLQVTTHLGSEIGPFSGETRSDSGVNALPTAAVVFQPEDSPWTYGLGLFAIGGFGQNYPGSTSNPILMPPPPGGTGVGPIYSKLAVMQLVPTVALKLTDRLSIGFAPTIVIADAALDPNILTTPTAPFTYPGATHARSHWGMGFQAGVYYEMDNCWRVGASYKSPQWIEDFTFFTDPATKMSISADYPGIISAGVAYYGIPRTVWAMDLRYLDYDNTELFGHAAGYDASGAVTGLGWKSIFSFATGVQYQLTDSLSVRAGYLFSENPISDDKAFFNAASSAIYQHIVSVGATWQLTCRTGLSIAYLKAFENSIEGPWNLPGIGPLPGSLIRETQTIDALVAGLQVRF